MPMRLCLTCGKKTTQGSYCPTHQPKRGSPSLHAERLGMTGWEWQAVKAQVLARDGGCLEPAPHAGPLEIDHVLPLAQGGTNEEGNLRTLCRAHHREATRAKARAKRRAD